MPPFAPSQRRIVRAGSSPMMATPWQSVCALRDGLERLREAIGARREVEHAGVRVLGQFIERALEGGGVVGLAVAARAVIALHVAPTRKRADELLRGLSRPTGDNRPRPHRRTEDPGCRADVSDAHHIPPCRIHFNFRSTHPSRAHPSIANPSKPCLGLTIVSSLAEHHQGSPGNRKSFEPQRTQRTGR